MGSGGGEAPTTNRTSISAFSGHFNPIGKSQLDWLPASGVLEAAISRTNRIHVFDTPVLEKDRVYALRVKKDAQRTYWVSARSRIGDNAWITNGVSLHWSYWPQLIGYSTLLDTTPGTEAGRQDSPILLGRTYSDFEANVHITPVARGGSAGDTWYDVVVNQGFFPDNQPPSATLTASTNRVAPNTPVTFSVAAVDPDDDRLAYFWEISDGSFGANTPNLTRTWTMPGDYRVRVEVSDRRACNQNHRSSVSAPTNSTRVSGVVLNDQTPVRDARWRTVRDPRHRACDRLPATFTDSDSAFAGQSEPGRQRRLRRSSGCITAPRNFNQIITVDNQRRRAPSSSRAQPHVTVQVAQSADLAAASARVRCHAGVSFGARSYPQRPPPNGKSSTNHGQTNALHPARERQPRVTSSCASPGVVNERHHPGRHQRPPAASLDASVMYALHEATYMTNMDDGSGTTTSVRRSRRLGGVASNTGQDKWFKHGEYVVGSPGAAAMTLAGVTPPLAIIGPGTATSENGGDSGLFVLVRTGPTNVPVDVRLAFGGTTTFDADYEPLASLVRIPAGVTSLRLPVFVRPDLYLEGNETLSVTVQPIPALSTRANPHRRQWSPAPDRRRQRPRGIRNWQRHRVRGRHPHWRSGQ
jgi:hypothetical protein